METSTGTKRVFLGGTCNESSWRDDLIAKLTINYFNPVVEDWTPECQEEELRQREKCDFVLYVITPEMTGVYSIAEVVDDSNKRSAKTIFCYTEETCKKTFSLHQAKSLKAVAKLVENNGATVCINLHELAAVLNNK